ncbi:helix-turn-helix transcriptional regulator [Paenibacillus sp. LjRoot153]|uniref:helix-turn-helix domain-containing protein n=1 Tax=Paenibacillus sp. LjRoot153 TaxID=3342270 RepID=UPI003ECEADF0
MPEISLSIDEHLMKYINDPKVINKLLAYFDRHENIGEEIFPYLGEKENEMFFPNHSLPKETFIRRIPFYFHRSKNKHGQIGELHHYISGIIREDKYYDRASEYIEQLFATLEDMHYCHLLDVEQIFNYPIKQTGYACQTEFLFQWSHYLELIHTLPHSDKMPKHFIVAYNEELERNGLLPIIYQLAQQYNYDYIRRDGQKFCVSGTFPCDDSGHPILRWIGIQIKNPVKVWAKVNGQLKGELFIQAGPKTSIWGLNCFGEQDDGSDAWYPLHIGPQLMKFDNEELKRIRDREGYTQKEIADAIGASVRTYQKWEAGETSPDSHNMLRLLNVLDIRDTKELTRFLDVKDIN